MAPLRQPRKWLPTWRTEPPGGLECLVHATARRKNWALSYSENAQNWVESWVIHGVHPMSMLFLRKLSTKKGHVYISDPVEIGLVMDLKCSGFIDAEVGPFLKGEGPPQQPRFAIVRGLTQDG